MQGEHTAKLHSCTKANHYNKLSTLARARINDWFQVIGVPLGRVRSGCILQRGVKTDRCERIAANLLYYERLLATVPPYPWPFSVKFARGFIY